MKPAAQAVNRLFYIFFLISWIDTLYIFCSRPIYQAFTELRCGTMAWQMTGLCINVKLSVGYHNAMKKIAGLNPWDGNHGACEEVEVDILNTCKRRGWSAYILKLSTQKTVLCTIWDIIFDFLLEIKI